MTTVKIRLEKGTLPGYTLSLDKKPRLLILRKLASAQGWGTVVKKLSVLRMYNKNNNPKNSRKFGRDLKYVQTLSPNYKKTPRKSTKVSKKTSKKRTSSKVSKKSKKSKKSRKSKKSKKSRKSKKSKKSKKSRKSKKSKKSKKRNSVKKSKKRNGSKKSKVSKKRK